MASVAYQALAELQERRVLSWRRGGDLPKSDAEDQTVPGELRRIRALKKLHCGRIRRLTPESVPRSSRRDEETLQ